MEGSVKGLSNAGYFNFGTIDLLGRIVLSWDVGWPAHWRKLSSILALYLLDDSSISHLIVTTKNVSKYCSMFPGGEGGLPLLENHYLMWTSLRGVLFHFIRSFYWLVKKMVPKVFVVIGGTTLFFLAMGQCHFFFYPDISKVPENGVYKSLRGSPTIAMLTWMDGLGERAFRNFRGCRKRTYFLSSPLLFFQKIMWEYLWLGSDFPSLHKFYCALLVSPYLGLRRH